MRSVFFISVQIVLVSVLALSLGAPAHADSFTASNPPTLSDVTVVSIDNSVAVTAHSADIDTAAGFRLHAINITFTAPGQRHVYRLPAVNTTEYIANPPSGVFKVSVTAEDEHGERSAPLTRYIQVNKYVTLQLVDKTAIVETNSDTTTVTVVCENDDPSMIRVLPAPGVHLVPLSPCAGSRVGTVTVF